MKIIVYTALFADENLPLNEVGEFFPFKHPKDGVEYIAFTNRRDLRSDFWDVQYKDLQHSSPRLDARYHKLMSHEVLPKHDVSIWLDSCCYFVYDPKSIIEKYLVAGSFDVAIHRHSDIENLMQEAVAQSWIYKNDTSRIVMNQLIDYEEIGFPILKYDHFETAIVMRMANTCVDMFNELWWDEVLDGSLRDQLSVPFVVWKCRKRGVKINTIQEAYVAHKYKQPIPKSNVFFTVPKPALSENLSRRTKY